MGLIRDKIKQLDRTQLYVIVALRTVLISQADFIEELNRDQLSKGERSDGSSLPNYSPVSVSMGKPVGAIKLFDTGDFWEGIEANLFDDELRFIGQDEKTSMLLEKYGNMVLGLNEENKQLLINRIKPLLQIEMTKFYNKI